MFFLKMLNIPAPALFAVSSDNPDPSDSSDISDRPDSDKKEVRNLTAPDFST